jgi:hypothetical protein
MAAVHLLPTELTLAQLRLQLRKRNLSCLGTKEEMCVRLRDALNVWKEDSAENGGGEAQVVPSGATDEGKVALRQIRVVVPDNGLRIAFYQDMPYNEGNVS